MTKLKTIICLTVATLALISCKSGYNKDYDDVPSTGSNGAPACDPTPVINNSDATKKVLKLIASFSCEDKTKNRVMAGQYLGTVADVDSVTNAYNTLMDTFITAKNTPAFISVEYGTASFSVDRMKYTNKTLKTHWDRGGLVSISWIPANPWETGFNSSYSDAVNLDALATDNANQAANKAALERWHKDISNLIEALKDLQNQNVVVLLRPLPAMNTDAYWWGTKATLNNEALFDDLWGDLFTRIKNAGVNNVLWVFSPADSSVGNNKPVSWGFADSARYVDIVAGSAKNDTLNIRDYQDYVSMNRPLGMSELSPSEAFTGKFDNRKYKEKLITDYPFIAYWLSRNDQSGHTFSLINNNFHAELLSNEAIYTREEINSENLRN